MDGRGKSIYLSDTVVILTADVKLITHRSLGFRPEEETISIDSVHEAIVDAIGSGMADQVDLFVTGVEKVGELSIKALENDLLDAIVQKYQSQGLNLKWDNSLIEWLVDTQKKFATERDWEHWVDNSLSPAIIPYIPQPGANKKVTLVVRMDGQNIQVSQS